MSPHVTLETWNHIPFTRLAHRPREARGTSECCSNPPQLCISTSLPWHPAHH